MGMLLALLMALGCTAAFAEGDDFSGTVTISLYSAKGVQEAWEAVGAAYTAKHPNVKVVVDLKPQDGYADWVKAAFQGYDSALPEADIVYGNLAGSDRVDKTVNFYEYAFDDSPYSDGTWADQIAFDLQNIDAVTGDWDCVSITAVQVLWFYNADIFAKVGVEAPKTWDEFVAVCEKLDAAGYQPVAVSGDFMSFWRSRWAGWRRFTSIRPPVLRSIWFARRKATTATIRTWTASSSMIPPIRTTTIPPRTSTTTTFVSGRASSRTARSVQIRPA